MRSARCWSSAFVMIVTGVPLSDEMSALDVLLLLQGGDGSVQVLVVRLEVAVLERDVGALRPAGC